MKNTQKALAHIHRTKPVILNLTNFVTMDFVANCLLAIGAAPIMSVCEEELEELILLSSVVTINIGTLHPAFLRLSQKAIQLATQHQKPIVLDPVGCGATKIRTHTALDFASHCSIIRGNASEIVALGHGACLTKGVESVHRTTDAMEVADKIATETGATVVISGSTDYITDGSRSQKIPFGSPIMSQITGMGCSLTAVIAAMLAVEPKSWEAATMATEYFALCGTLASLQKPLPGTFKSTFLDTLHSPDFDAMNRLYD